MSIIPHQGYNPYNMMNPQQMASGAGLPFQQIDGRHTGGMGGNADMLLQQRINERNNLDTNMGGAPMMPQQMMPQQMMPQQMMPQQMSQQMMPQQMSQQMMPQMPGQLPLPTVQLNRGMANAHPALVHKFLGMNPIAQQQWARQNPVIYAQIYQAIQQSQQSQQIHMNQPEYQQQHRRNDSEAESESSGLSEHTEETSDDNHHSSDDDGELNKKITTKPTKTKAIKTHKTSTRHHKKIKPRQDKGVIYLPIDFRSNLCEMDGASKYIVKFPSRHNVYGIQLESCIIECVDALENEPYIYLSIDEIEGDYCITGDRDLSVFGKLVQDKQVNNFIYYRPENCIKEFNTPQRLNQLALSFLRYDQQPIPLGKIQIKEIRKSRGGGHIKIITKAPHHLQVGDPINITHRDSDCITVDSVEVLDTSDAWTARLDKPICSLSSTSHQQISMEKVGLKCTLTFKIITS